MRSRSLCSRILMPALWLATGLLLAAVLTGCGGADNTLNPSNGSLLPLAQGNHWTYQDTSDSATTTQTITGTRDIGGITAFVMKDTEGNETYITANEQGIEILGAADVLSGLEPVLYVPALQVLEFPVTVGKTWTQQVTLSTGITFQYEFTIGACETVQVPAGLFGNCYRVQQKVTFPDGSVRVGRAWFSPNVGMVKSQTINALTQEIVGEQVLTGYGLN